MARPKPYTVGFDGPFLVGDVRAWSRTAQPPRDEPPTESIKWTTKDGRWQVGWWTQVNGVTWGWIFRKAPGGQRAGGEVMEYGVGPEWVEAQLRAEGFAVDPIRQRGGEELRPLATSGASRPS